MSNGTSGQGSPDSSPPSPEVLELSTVVHKAGEGQQRLFGRYLLERELGRGGMGVVWLATDEKLNISVALKFLPSMVAQDVEAIADLKKEILKGFALTHPGLVRLYSFEQDEFYAAIIMEYIDGQNLTEAKVRQPGGCFNVAEIAPWVEQLCEVLMYAHENARIVHRDLKPRNLMLTSNGDLKVADFGIASSISDTVSRASMKVAGSSSGTPAYMSPQQAMGELPSVADDVHAFGATVYDLLTGKPPFFSGNVLQQVLYKVPPTMTDRRLALGIADKAPIPETWERTVAACLAKEPSERPASVRELWAMLQGRSAGVSVTAPAEAEPEVTSAWSQHATEFSPEKAQVSDASLPEVPPKITQSSQKDSFLVYDAGNHQAPRRRQTIRNSFLIVGALLLAAILLAGFASKILKKNETNISQPNATETKISPIEVRNTKAPLFLPNIALISKDAPYENSLGMRFVPVPIVGGPTEGKQVLLSIWETRVRDYGAYAKSASSVNSEWETSPGFEQGEDHPVVNVNWEDAKAFCEWLTETERAAGRLPQGAEYRLPTDHEWSCAVGIGDQEQASAGPDEKDGKITGYPWGQQWPPPRESGNFNPRLKVDHFDYTAPVGSFGVNRFGLYDLAGNVWELCADRYNPADNENLVVRGGSWDDDAEFSLRASHRASNLPMIRCVDYGFRCVLVLSEAAN